MKRVHRILCLLCSCLLLGGCTAKTAPPTEQVSTAPTEAPLPETADIKVMSWNILNPSWGGGPAYTRIDIIADTLEQEGPDVIGLQEASAEWHEELAALPSRYAPVNDTTDSGDAAMTFFLYNTDTLTLEESGIDDLDAGSDIRLVSWAVFTVKDTSASFLITNTHPHAEEVQCMVHTQAYLDIANKHYRDKGLPMLNVGDFNAVEDSKAYRMHTADGFTDCKYADGVDLLEDVDSYLVGDFGGSVSSGLGSRDHVFFKGDITPLTFTTLYEGDIRYASDHLPVVATVRIH